MTLFELFCTFFYIGLFTIGGGVVALTLMQQTIVAQGLISTEQFYNMIAVSESTPGPLGTNMATYIGYNLFGVPGGFIATMGEVLPSIIIIIIVAHFLTKFNQNIYIKGAFTVLRPLTTGLIMVPVVQIFVHSLLNLPSDYSVLLSLAGWKGLFDWISLAFYAVCTFCLLKIKLHPILVIAMGAVFGIIFL